MFSPFCNCKLLQAKSGQLWSHTFPPLYLFISIVVNTCSHRPSVDQVFVKNATTRSLDSLSPKTEKLLNSICPQAEFCQDNSSAAHPQIQHLHVHLCLHTVFSEAHPHQKPQFTDKHFTLLAAGVACHLPQVDGRHNHLSSISLHFSFFLAVTMSLRI